MYLSNDSATEIVKGFTLMRIAVCDDLENERKKLIEALGNVLNDFVVNEFEDGNQLLESHAVMPYDLIILDILMPKINGIDTAAALRKTDTKTPVVFMDEVFDREYIQRKFENMRYLSEAGRTIRKGIDSLFMNLLDETRFFVLDQESSYDENVDRMVRALTNQGELDAGFAQRVREREKYSTMVLDQNIAFPHTKNMLPKLTLAMGVFPDMLKDDKYGNIRIIILLGIPESMEDDTVLVRLYDDILSIGKKPDVIPKIQKMESYREFLLYNAEENNIFE